MTHAYLSEYTAFAGIDKPPKSPAPEGARAANALSPHFNGFRAVDVFLNVKCCSTS